MTLLFMCGLSTNTLVSYKADFLSTVLAPSNIPFIHNYDMDKTSPRKYLKSNIDDLQIVCGVCDKRSAVLRWDENYVGYRGRCSICEFDWPES